MIEFFKNLDGTSVAIGMVYSYLVGTVVSIINYYTEKALKLREERRNMHLQSTSESVHSEGMVD